MSNMNGHSSRTIIFRGIGIFAFFCILVFMYFKFQAFIFGPSLTSISLEDYTVIQSASLELTGQVKHTEQMLINGRSIALGEGGVFQETLVFPPGENILEIEMIDPFAKTRFYRYSIYADYTVEARIENHTEPEEEILEEEPLDETINEE